MPPKKRNLSSLPGEPEEPKNKDSNYEERFVHTELCINQKATNILIRKNKGVTMMKSGMRIKTGEGKEDYEEYEHVSDLGHGSFADATKVYNKRLDKFFALKIFDVKKQKKADKWSLEEVKLMDLVSNECRVWEKLVNNHIPRLYEWDKNDTEDIVVARSELADIGDAGVFDHEKYTYTIHKRVYDLFLEKIIKEDRILRQIDKPDQFMTENKAKVNREKVEMKDVQKVLKPQIQKRIKDHQKLIEPQKNNEEVDNDQEEFEDDDYLMDFDIDGYDDDGLDALNMDTSVLQRPSNMTKIQAEKLELRKKKWCKDIVFHEELKEMLEPNQKQFVVGRIFFDICIGLYYMHLWKIAHQDIKLDNFVISSKNNGTAMLIDFNGSKQIEDETVKLYDVTGTEMFYPPEFSAGARRFQPFKYDMFSLGAVLYSLYYGKLCSINKDFQIDNIDFPDATPYPIQELMQGQLTLDPYTRWEWENVWGCLLFKLLHKKIEIKMEKPVLEKKMEEKKMEKTKIALETITE